MVSHMFFPLVNTVVVCSITSTNLKRYLAWDILPDFSILINFELPFVYAKTWVNLTFIVVTVKRHSYKFR